MSGILMFEADHDASLQDVTQLPQVIYLALGTIFAQSFYVNFRFLGLALAR